MAGRRVPESKWRERIAQWRNSAMFAREYAEQQGFSLERLTYWARRADREAQGQRLLPLQVQAAASVPGLR
ncbi:IS66 family insertion sequence element accessory protein TnpA [Pseudoduganella lutea]|uniref:Uncharacterized protein n=1 Tax=Pseudoduganella lutea TaxID=321985 RepID=A0A4P6L4I8_9BURK|nr:hypothetical protein [Pseudoduganella lutea]QBE65778.1 hypothetical protein EWM63_24675 [Pseudoduganella lutea]